MSEASIVRFAQALGYSGFHALKISLAEDLVSPMLLVHEDPDPDDDPAGAVKSHDGGDAFAGDTTHPGAADARSGKWSDSAMRLHRHFCVRRRSIPLAMDLNFRLTKIGLYSRFSLDPTTQEMYASLTTPEDVAIGISHTGSSKDTVYALELAKERGRAPSASPIIPSHPWFAMATFVCSPPAASAFHPEDGLESGHVGAHGGSLCGHLRAALRCVGSGRVPNHACNPPSQILRGSVVAGSA
ncbi:MAG: MurR/RpiR family transcriptional regulator [Caldilineaceae bacterium]